MNYCVFVGRFQPFHNGHLKVALRAFEEADHLIIVIGSHRAPLTIKNPWNFEYRKAMVLGSIPQELHSRLTILPLRDFIYNDLAWITSLQNITGKIIKDNHTKLIGCFKDDSSYYLKLFPQWELVREPYYWQLDSSHVRELLFDTQRAPLDLVPKHVAVCLETFAASEDFKNLASEWDFLKRYRQKWGGSPFPPVFVTTDAVVVQAGHILLVRRGRNPGKGMFALPGGFIKQTETIFQSALRELKEETKILIPTDVLKGSLKRQHVFDHPQRDMRGRTITHAFYFELDPGGPLPSIEGDDDAAEALWLPINDLAIFEQEFYSDHLHIIEFFLRNL